MHYKILIPDKLEPKVTEILEQAAFTVTNKPGISVAECAAICQEYHAMIVRSGIKINPEIIDAAKSLRLVVRAGVGYDNIDVNYAAKKGVLVENTPFGNVNAAAEHTITLLMMLAKHVIHSHLELKKGVWNRKHESTELKNKTLGIIGLGNVGKKVAKVALALEMNVMAFDPFVDKDAMQAIGIIKSEVDQIIAIADYISVHVPLTEKTRNLISEAEFAKMKTGVRILNVARGGVINERALENAIKSGKVAAAALDVYETEPPICHNLISDERVICTPHLGASTKEAQQNVGIDAAYQVIEFFRNNQVINPVNSPKLA